LQTYLNRAYNSLTVTFVYSWYFVLAPRRRSDPLSGHLYSPLGLFTGQPCFGDELSCHYRQQVFGSSYPRALRRHFTMIIRRVAVTLQLCGPSHRTASKICWDTLWKTGSWAYRATAPFLRLFACVRYAELCCLVVVESHVTQAAHHCLKQ
jgi:hypothetical protein